MIIQDENGNDIEVFSADEVAAQAQAKADEVAAQLRAELETKYQAELAEKDNHLKTKLDEFTKGKKGVEGKEKEAEEKLAEAVRIANEAKEIVVQSETKKNEAIKTFWVSQTVGTDPELTKRLQEAYEMINYPINDETDIAKRVGLAANLIGLSPAATPSMSFAGGVPPVTTPTDSKNPMPYNDFLDTFGLQLPAEPKQ